MPGTNRVLQDITNIEENLEKGYTGDSEERDNPGETSHKYKKVRSDRRRFTQRSPVLFQCSCQCVCRSNKGKEVVENSNSDNQSSRSPSNAGSSNSASDLETRISPEEISPEEFSGDSQNIGSNSNSGPSSSNIVAGNHDDSKSKPNKDKSETSVECCDSDADCDTSSDLDCEYEETSSKSSTVSGGNPKKVKYSRFIRPRVLRWRDDTYNAYIQSKTKPTLLERDHIHRYM